MSLLAMKLGDGGPREGGMRGRAVEGPWKGHGSPLEGGKNWKDGGIAVPPIAAARSPKAFDGRIELTKGNPFPTPQVGSFRNHMQGRVRGIEISVAGQRGKVANCVLFCIAVRQLPCGLMGRACLFFQIAGEDKDNEGRPNGRGV